MADTTRRRFLGFLATLPFVGKLFVEAKTPDLRGEVGQCFGFNYEEGFPLSSTKAYTEMSEDEWRARQAELDAKLQSDASLDNREEFIVNGTLRGQIRTGYRQVVRAEFIVLKSKYWVRPQQFGRQLVWVLREEVEGYSPRILKMSRTTPRDTHEPIFVQLHKLRNEEYSASQCKRRLYVHGPAYGEMSSWSL